MSTEARIQTDQSTGNELPDASASRATTPSHSRDNPQTLIQESIKYRRRAQEAERRAESLEAEVQDLRQNQEGRAAELEADLTTVRGENCGKPRMPSFSFQSRSARGLFTIHAPLASATDRSCVA